MCCESRNFTKHPVLNRFGAYPDSDGRSKADDATAWPDWPMYRRERAAYLLNAYLQWGLVPPTVIRDDFPLGVGSLQWFVPIDHGPCFSAGFKLRTVILDFAGEPIPASLLQAPGVGHVPTSIDSCGRATPRRQCQLGRRGDPLRP